jgi:hypothetical protein
LKQSFADFRRLNSSKELAARTKFSDSRAVQFQLERENAMGIETQDVENALDEMLFSGGSLNVKLLGGNGDGMIGGG